jgi:hypothetical protein
MADTLPNITIPEQTWVDLYAASGIAIGTQILVQNIGACDIYLTSQASQPTDDTAHQIIKRSQFAINDAGDTGAWAYCREGGLVNVRLP